jgi:hypothetical protein
VCGGRHGSPKRATICVSIQDGLDDRPGITDCASLDGSPLATVWQIVIYNGRGVLRLHDTEQDSAELARRLSLSA